jgi:hypothetical protein
MVMLSKTTLSAIMLCRFFIVMLSIVLVIVKFLVCYAVTMLSVVFIIVMLNVVEPVHYHHRISWSVCYFQILAKGHKFACD